MISNCDDSLHSEQTLSIDIDDAEKSIYYVVSGEKQKSSIREKTEKLKKKEKRK